MLNVTQCNEPKFNQSSLSKSQCTWILLTTHFIDGNNSQHILVKTGFVFDESNWGSRFLPDHPVIGRTGEQLCGIARHFRSKTPPAEAVTWMGERREHLFTIEFFHMHVHRPPSAGGHLLGAGWIFSGKNRSVCVGSSHAICDRVEITRVLWYSGTSLRL